MCNIEFPHFGASYPDAHCINGYLWDMDSYENGCYTIGGDDPCPFCNTEAWLKTVLDNEEFASREEALEWVEKMREKWGAEHRGSSEIPKDLEEAAVEYSKKASDGHNYRDLRVGFITGAKWDRQQMMKEAVEGVVTNADGVFGYDVAAFRFDDNHTYSVLLPHEEKRKYGDKVRMIVIPKTDEK